VELGVQVGKPFRGADISPSAGMVCAARQALGHGLPKKGQHGHGRAARD